MLSRMPARSIRMLEDVTALYLNTSHGTLIHLDLQGNILSSMKITENFLRGLLVLPNGQLVMGLAIRWLYLTGLP